MELTAVSRCAVAEVASQREAHRSVNVSLSSAHVVFAASAEESPSRVVVH